MNYHIDCIIVCQNFLSIITGGGMFSIPKDGWGSLQGDLNLNKFYSYKNFQKKKKF